MPFPKTETDLRAAGYDPPLHSVKCQRCKAEIEFWRTPSGKQIPLDSGTLEPHFATCPFADEFRK